MSITPETEKLLPLRTRLLHKAPLLWVVPAMYESKHGCKGFGFVPDSAALALVRIKKTILFVSEVEGSQLLRLLNDFQ